MNRERIHAIRAAARRRGVELPDKTDEMTKKPNIETTLDRFLPGFTWPDGRRNFNIILGCMILGVSNSLLAIAVAFEPLTATIWILANLALVTITALALRRAYREDTGSFDRYRRIFEAAPLALAAVSNDRVVMSNTRFARLFGEKLSQGHETITARFSWPVAEALENPARALMTQTTDAAPMFLEAYDTAGQLFPVAVESHLLTNAGESVYLLTIRDRRPEIRLQEQERALADERQQSQKLKTIGSLSAGIAHDFNNVLQIVLAHGQKLSLEDLTAEQRASLYDGLVSAVQQGSQQTRRLLQYSRRSRDQRVFVDLSDRLKDLITLWRRSFPSAIDFDIDLSDSVPRVHANQDHLDQVFMNLAINARDAMPDGGKISIDASSARLPGPDGELSVPGVRVRFRDNGVGMSEDTLERIFELYFTTKGQTRGTRLGLSVVQGIDHDHNGDIRCRSAPGRGTTFELYLRCSPSEPQAS